MKRLAVIFGILLFCAQAVLADEVANIQPEQKIKNDQSYFSANIQKQPQEKGSKQAIRNHFTFFTININNNGKVFNVTLPEQ